MNAFEKIEHKDAREREREASCFKDLWPQKKCIGIIKCVCVCVCKITKKKYKVILIGLRVESFFIYIYTICKPEGERDVK